MLPYAHDQARLKPPASIKLTAMPNTTMQDADFSFLDGLDHDLRRSLLVGLRTLWTHSSTALEGNTFTLGDTAFFLQEGLTVGGKTLREHGEIRGHAEALDFACVLLRKPHIAADDLFKLHTLIQTNAVVDVYSPIGAWKVEPNGAYAVGEDGKSFFLEYPSPKLAADLMETWIAWYNRMFQAGCTKRNAAETYSATHTAFVRIHPFADGNGRMARILANLPLLRSGLPPILIAAAARQEYISILSQYAEQAGTITVGAPFLPPRPALTRFTAFCASQWTATWAMIEEAWETQKQRTACFSPDARTNDVIKK